MKKTNALVLQSWFDISIKHTGNVLNAFDIALANDQSITDKIDVNAIIVIPDNLLLNNKELQYYNARNINPATGLTLTNENMVIGKEIGIGAMVIGSTFIVD